MSAQAARTGLPRRVPDARERAHGRAGPVGLRWGEVRAGGAGLAWQQEDRWHARLHLWSGARALRGHWLWRTERDGIRHLHWRPDHGQPWRARCLAGSTSLRFLAWGESASRRPPCVLRIALRVSPAGLALLRRALWPLCLPSGTAGLAAAAAHVVAWADLPFACSPVAAFARLELAGVLVGEPAARAGSDPWARWTGWAEQQASDARAMQRALDVRDADLLIDLQDFGAAARRAGLAGYAPRLAQPDGMRRYALVDALAACDQMTLAHELGHLIGAGHAPAHGVASTLDRLAASGRAIGARGLACASARGWQSPRRGVQTVMGGLGADADRVYETLPLWSEPGLTWDGRRTDAVGTRARGARGVADDAGWWAQAAPGYRRVRGHEG